MPPTPAAAGRNWATRPSEKADRKKAEMAPSDYFFLAFVIASLLLVGLALYVWVVRIGEIEFGLGVLIIAGLTELIRHFAPLVVWHLASGAPQFVRYWTWRSELTVQGASPLLLVGATWLLNRRGVLDRFYFYLAAVAAICSGLFIAWSLWRALAPYYPRHSAFMLAFYYADYFALAGALIPVLGSVQALRQAPVKSVATPLRRAASSLHGKADWFPVALARKRFSSGGIIIGEAYRPDLNPNLAGKAPLLPYAGDTPSRPTPVSPPSRAYK